MAEGMEKHLLAVKTIIAAGIAAQLAAIAAEMADGVTLTAPTANDYYIHELPEIVDFPVIQIIPDRSDFVLTGVQHDECDHKMIIVCHNVATEGRVDFCAYRSYRFARAIREIFVVNRTLSNSVIEAYITAIDYKPMFTDGNMFKQEVWIYMTVKSEER